MLLQRLARPAAPSGPLSDAARELIAWAWRGVDPARVLDTHVHVVGLGTGGTGCFANERMQSFWHPISRAQFAVYKEAIGITDLSRADEQYVERLMSLLESQKPRGRLLLLAFDQFHDEQGKADPAQSEFFVPNEHILALAERRPDLFVASASVHPYRSDAVEALEHAAEAGAVAVKWLPNAMNIDPSSARCDAFYDALVRLRLTLLTHTGEEKAVHAESLQRFGNPLLLRRPLERGVRVIAAHCASLGQNADLDRKDGAKADNFALFVRLFEDDRYEHLLFADISAMPQFNRIGEPLRRILVEKRWHGRLLNASDYPLPAIHILMQTRAIAKAGFITAEQRELLNEIDRHNPLLFDFVLKRCLAVRDGSGEHRFAEGVFMSARTDVFPRLSAAR